jgi:hypothetical protein
LIQIELKKIKALKKNFTKKYRFKLNKTKNKMLKNFKLTFSAHRKIAIAKLRQYKKFRNNVKKTNDSIKENRIFHDFF